MGLVRAHKVKVSIIGIDGRMGQIHRATAEEWGAEITSADDADIVVVASPDNTHFAYVLKHLTAGQSVFCEKPLATTMEQLDRLDSYPFNSMSDGGLGCHLPLRQFANDFEIEGTTVDLVYDYGRKTKFLTSWRNDPDYDLVMGGGIHLMDLWMQKTGIREIEVKWASRSKQSSEAKCPDMFVGKYKSGPHEGLLKVDFTKDGPHRHCVAWISGAWINEKPTDKQYQLRAFLDNPKTDTAAIAAHRACLQFRSVG